MDKALTNLDEIEIEETFKSRISLDERDHKYADVEWVALDDKNNGNYKQPIYWDTSDMKDRLPIYRESYTAIPLIAQSSTAVPYNDKTRLAYKCSVLSLIYSLLVQPVGSGPALVNEHEGQLPLMNNLRLLTHSDVDWVESTGEELHFFGCDRQLPSNVMGDNRALDGASSRVQASVAFPNNSIHDNPALASRVTIFTNQSESKVAGEFHMIVTIPLKYIHPLFDQLGFALPNYPMRIKMGLSSYTSGCSDFMPITTVGTSDPITIVDGSDTPTSQAALAVAAPPVLKIDPVAVSFRGYAPGSCRLYVKCVILKPADRKKLDEQLSSGFKKTITFLTTDFRKKKFPAKPDNGESVHWVVAENVPRPVRVWAMFPPAGAQESAQSTFPATIGQAYATQVSLKLNSSEFRKSPIESQLALYNELRQYQLGSGHTTQQGARITYNDYLHGMNPILFDVSRHPSVLNNLPITFTFDAKLVGPIADYDAIFLIERYRTAVINITRNSAKTDAEDGLDLGEKVEKE